MSANWAVDENGRASSLPGILFAQCPGMVNVLLVVGDVCVCVCACCKQNAQSTQLRELGFS